LHIVGRQAWRATHTPDGPVTTHLVVDPATSTVRVEAWGPGASWAVEAAPELVGDHDDDSGFEAHHGVVADLHRRLVGLRVPRSRAVTEAIVPAIIRQKVLGEDARDSYGALIAAFGSSAPAPGDTEGLRLPPDPAALAATPSWALHRFGLERKRAETLQRACSYAHRLEETTGMGLAEGRARLIALPGVGPWTAAEVALVALGDADAVSVGDYHIPNLVAWALAGQARGDDATMLELLEPYRGHRGRVIRLLMAGGIQPPRFGPKSPRRRLGQD
jgi:3-methyladenine DNA glycosylase/8-oxoguanine DNA glycosylase